MAKETQIGLHTSWLVHLLSLSALLLTYSPFVVPPHVRTARGVITLHASLVPQAAEEFIADLHVHVPGVAQEHVHPHTPLTIHSHPRHSHTPVRKQAGRIPELETTGVLGPVRSVPTKAKAVETTLTEISPHDSEEASKSLPRGGRTSPSPAIQVTVAAPPPASTPGATTAEPPIQLPNNPAPPYPPEAYRLGQQGRVLLEASLDLQGKVTSIRLIESSGTASLDQAALDTVRRWEFKPAQRGNVPIPFVIRVPIRFSIRNS